MADSFAPEMLVLAFAIATAAGAIRGLTGFGGAMVMTPPLALLFGPLVAVPVVLLVESVMATPMLMQTRREVRWRVMAPILLATCVTVPLGGHLLVTLDPQLLRRIIAGVVIVFALVLLRGWRYSGSHRPGTAVALGAASGVLLGATSMGGPPIILYLLSGPDSVNTTRANLTLFVALASVAGLVMLWSRGVLNANVAWKGALLAPGYFVGVLLGTRLLRHFDDARFRRFTLFFLIAVSAGILVA